MPEYRAKLYRGWWYAVWTEDGRTRRETLRTQIRDEALSRLEDFKAEKAAPRGSTVGEIVQAYLDYKRDRVADLKRMELAWEASKRHFAHLRPDQITYDLSEAYIESRRKLGRSDGTILKEINTIRQALNWRKVNVAQFDAPSQPPPRDRHLTKEEFRLLLDKTIQPHIRLWMILAIATGARKGALLDLTWDQVDFARERIKLVKDDMAKKKGRAVTVPITPQAMEALKEAHQARQTDQVIEYAGRPVGNIKKGFALAVSRAGLEDVTPHDLRHTAAVWMAEDGVPMEEIAQYLGHSSTKVTFSVYARFSPTHLKRASRALEF